jgi:hypothetical protein
MFMLRLVSQVVFQPRLAVLAKTLTAQVNDLSHFMFVFMFINVMVAMVSILKCT